MALEKTLESLLDCKEIKEAILKEISRDSSLVRLMLKLTLQYFGHLMLFLIRKDSDAGRDWGQDEKGMMEDTMAGWHHQLPSSLKLMSIESVMPSSHFILCHPLLLLPSIFPSIRVFSNESALRIRCEVSASKSVLPVNTQD